MKKFLLVPVAATVLAACSTQPPAPVVNVGNQPFGDMVQIPEQTDASWQSSVQDLSKNYKPNNEQVVSHTRISTSTTHYRQFDHNFRVPRNQAGKPIYSQITKGSYKGQQYRVELGDTMFFIAYISGRSIAEIAQLNHLKAPYDLHLGQVITLWENAPVAQSRQSTYQTSTRDNVEIPRNPDTNKPLYNEIKKGFYHGKTYTVHKGDTLYLVSYISGQDVEDIARLNHLQPPYDLHPGQVIKLANSVPATAPVMQADAKVTAQAATPVKKVTQIPAPASNGKWTWPAKGDIVRGFSADNKGIDIAGKLGTPVLAAAAGRVVYAGNGLQGYGNLILIKHNDDYLSAYAHNQQILVKDKQWVQAGQEIATMGSTDADRVKLHFEIRHKATTVNPLNFLPK